MMSAGSLFALLMLLCVTYVHSQCYTIDVNFLLLNQNGYYYNENGALYPNYLNTEQGQIWDSVTEAFFTFESFQVRVFPEIDGAVVVLYWYANPGLGGASVYLEYGFEYDYISADIFWLEPISNPQWYWRGFNFTCELCECIQ